MNRIDFLGELRRGLLGLPPAQIEDLVTDYESHFSEGLAAGRSEDEIAAALGDPARLARELRAEAGFRRWESERTPGSLAGVVLALLGLATFDLMFMIPFLFALAAFFVGFGAATLGVFICGIVISMLSLFPGLPLFGLAGHFSGALAMGLLGVGLIAGSVGLGALFWLVLDFVAKLLVRYARLHFQLINAVNA
jgi:uncharacterized membrane protein